MGECSSRPHFAKVKEHLHYSISVNDPYFHYKLPVLPPYSQHDETELRDRLAFVEEKLKKLLVSSHRSTLVVEVRKGINIPSRHKRTRAKMTTYPSMKEFYTSYSEPYLPKWFNVFHISYDPVECPIEGFIVEVWDCDDGVEQAIGSTHALLSQTNEVTCRWLDLSMNEDYIDEVASVEVRSMNVKDRHAYWHLMKSELQDLISGRASAVVS